MCWKGQMELLGLSWSRGRRQETLQYGQEGPEEASGNFSLARRRDLASVWICCCLQPRATGDVLAARAHEFLSINEIDYLNGLSISLYPGPPPLRPYTYQPPFFSAFFPNLFSSLFVIILSFFCVSLCILNLYKCQFSFTQFGWTNQPFPAPGEGVVQGLLALYTGPGVIVALTFEGSHHFLRLFSPLFSFFYKLFGRPLSEE